MVQVIHRGDEATQGVTIPSATEGLSEFLSRVENRERYEKELQMRREQQLLDLMSVNTDNLIFEQYQGKASELLDGFVNNATSVYKNKKGVLSAEDKMNLMRERQKVEMQVGGMRSKAQMYIQAKNALIQDGGTDLDWEESWESLDNFRKDPVNTDPPSLVPAYIDPIVDMARRLDKEHPYTRPTSVKIQLADGTWKEDFVSYRRGLETEEAQKAWLEKQLENRNYRRAVMSKKFYKGNTDAFFADGEPLVRPVYSSNYTPASGYTKNIYGGNEGNISYTVETYSDIGKAVNITGNFPKMTLQTEDGSKQVTVTAIGAKGIKGSYDMEEIDTSVDGVEASGNYAEAIAKGKLEARGVKVNKVQQATNGKWYPVITKTKNALIKTNTPELKNNYNIIYNAVQEKQNINRDGFNKAWGIFSPSLNEIESTPPESIARPSEEVTAVKKEKSVTSQPKKEEKKKGVQGSFFN